MHRHTANLLIVAFACRLATLPCPGETTSLPAAAPAPAQAGAWLGDAGHYLTGQTKIHLLNASGGDFSVTLYRYNWPFEGHWNQRRLPLTVTGPAGEIVLQATVEADEAGQTLTVPPAGKGVYTLQVRSHSLNYWHVSTSLPRAVVWTGPGTDNASPYHGQWLTVAPMVPRTWYFLVPQGTTFFTIKTQSHPARTQREDQGLIVRSPRGQPVAALWDQPNPSVRDGQIVSGQTLHLEQEANIVVDPGSDGRFWSLEVRLGGGHTWTDYPIALLGVPPYLAQTPDMWFNPATGEIPARLVYDEQPFVRTQMPPVEAQARPHLAYWMPSPAIGDPAANEIHTPAKIAFWNPENRELDLALATYLPRNMQPVSADLRFASPPGQTVFTDRASLSSDEKNPYRRTLRFHGVGLLEVANCERFWAYTYPATAAVLVGEPIDQGWQRLRLEAGSLRHWFFHVPAATRQFQVRLKTLNPNDVVDLEIHAPDRLLARLYGRQATTLVEVPEGLDDRIWHVRLDVGGATRYLPAAGHPRYAVIPLELDFHGLPACLAPTWEQWFDPALPR